MITFPWSEAATPIGLDLGTRAIKLVQFNASGSEVRELSRWDLPENVWQAEPEERKKMLADALQAAWQGKNFAGTQVVLCLGPRDLFVQNVRVPKATGPEFERAIHQEVAGRLPFSLGDAELRFVEAADVRQGEAMLREVIVFACHRPGLEHLLECVETAGLTPVGVDVEPLALLRVYARQFRRDEDKRQRVLFVQVGYTRTTVVISEGEDVLFIKNLELGGAALDEAVARHLKMPPADAAALRRHNGDRRSDQQNPEIAKSVTDAVRPVIDRLASELSMCVRYHSVTFRGQPLARLVLGGGEAGAGLLESLGRRIELKCELGEPFRNLESSQRVARPTQWDVAAGLAMKEILPA